MSECNHWNVQSLEPRESDKGWCFCSLGCLLIDSLVSFGLGYYVKTHYFDSCVLNGSQSTEYFFSNATL